MNKCLTELSFWQQFSQTFLERQRRVFVTLVVEGVPLDARRKFRAYLAAHGRVSRSPA
jgi:hypothetical protein